MLQTAEEFTLKESERAASKKVRWLEAPPPYPNGWIGVMESHMLKPGQILPLVIMERDLVVFRGNDPTAPHQGHAHVMDAFCPHMGAHFASGGRVLSPGNAAPGGLSDCIQCPFHKWVFRGLDGGCVSAPPCDKAGRPPPRGVRLRSWLTREVDGLICIWVHADPSVEPTWYPIKVPEIASGLWIYIGRTEHEVKCHIQDIPENGADIAHLEAIHQVSLTAGSSMDKVHTPASAKSWWLKLFEHRWASSWDPDPEVSHLAHMTLEHETLLFGVLSLLKMTLKVTQEGPVSVKLHIHARLPLGMGTLKGVLIQSITPIGPYQHRLVHRMFSENTIWGRLFGKFILQGEATQLGRDIWMWNNKKFVRRPALLKEEKSVARFRRWYAQFYPDPAQQLLAAEKTSCNIKDLTDW